MTYRNKGLRGFLALLMAALMVLGMCGFGYAADALEDVEVDESVFSAAPDEDDVEVVTQREMEDNYVTINLSFVDDNDSSIAHLISGVDYVLFLVSQQSGGTEKYINVRKQDGGIWTGLTDVPADSWEITGMPEIPIAGYTRDAITVKINSADFGNINDVIEFDKDAYSVTIDITYHYKKQCTVNYKLVKNGKTYFVGEKICDEDAVLKLAQLPDVKGRTVIGWFDKGTFEEKKDDEKVYPEGGDSSGGSGGGGNPGDGEELPPADGEVAASLELVEQAAFGFGQYGQYVKPGTPITVNSNRTFYAYALSSGGTVTYSAYLRINKVDADGNPVAGAGFTVSNGSTTQGSIGLTDEQGQLVMGLLDTGEFTITETTVPEGYVAGEPVSVTVTSANTRENPCNVTIVNAKAGAQPTGTPTGEPTATPAPTPSGEPTVSPTDAPSGEPTVSPTDAPSETPTVSPTDAPTVSPTDAPTGEPTVSPTDKPTARPTAAPTDEADGEEVPKTGDNGLGYLYALMGLSELGIAAMLLMLRKLRRS